MRWQCYGDGNITEIGCVAASNYILQDGDCDDADPLDYPTNTESCDGQDNNCDGLVDDNDPLVVGQTTFYQDLDGDGVGGSLAQNTCFQPSGFVTGTGDCDDLNNTVYPSAPEISIQSTIPVMDWWMTTIQMSSGRPHSIKIQMETAMVQVSSNCMLSTFGLCADNR